MDTDRCTAPYHHHSWTDTFHVYTALLEKARAGKASMRALRSDAKTTRNIVGALLVASAFGALCFAGLFIMYGLVAGAYYLLLLAAFLPMAVLTVVFAGVMLFIRLVGSVYETDAAVSAALATSLDHGFGTEEALSEFLNDPVSAGRRLFVLHSAQVPAKTAPRDDKVYVLISDENVFNAVDMPLTYDTDARERALAGNPTLVDIDLHGIDWSAPLTSDQIHHARIKALLRRAALFAVLYDAADGQSSRLSTYEFDRLLRTPALKPHPHPYSDSDATSSV